MRLFVAPVAAVSGAVPADPAGAAKKTHRAIRPATTARSRSSSRTNRTRTRATSRSAAEVLHLRCGPEGRHQLCRRSPHRRHNLTDYVRGLEKHPQHGYHIKLTTTIKNANGSSVPGGVKHMVFWITCTPPPAEEAPGQQAASTLRIAEEQVGAGQGPFKPLVCTRSPLDRESTLQAGEQLDITDVPPGTTCDVKEPDRSTIVTFKNKFPGDQVVAAPSNEDIRPPAGTPAGSGGNRAPASAAPTRPSPAATCSRRRRRLLKRPPDCPVRPATPGR